MTATTAPETVITSSKGKCYLKIKDDPRTSNYEDDIWDMTAVGSTTKTHSTINFTTFPEPRKTFLKQYAYALLNEAPYNGAKPFKPLTVIYYVRAVSKFLAWVEEEKNKTLPEITPQDLNSYLYLTETIEGLSTGRINETVISIQRIYEYRSFITLPNFTFFPWDGKDATKVTGRRPRQGGENTTPRIPEEITRPLLSWALFYVETVSDEILKQIRGEKIPVTIDPLTGKPWRKRSERVDRRHGEEDVLRTACKIVILYLTGMRFKEAVSIRPGSVTLLRDGEIPLYNIKARTFKTFRDPRGVEVTWVAPQQVAKAISILETISDSPYLFAKTRSYNAEFVGPESVGTDVDRFQRYINRRYANDTRTGFPMEGGKPYRVTSRMFRRTLAAYIAAEPYGIVAGMMQYKHLQVATFEGYAGTSESGFAIEIRQQQQLSRENDMLRIYTEAKNNEPLIGPGAITLMKDLGLADGATYADESRVTAMLKSRTKTLHRGELNDCFYDPTKSLCRSVLQRDTDKAKQGEDTPLFSACEPLNCGCSVIDGDKLAAWKALETKFETLLNNPTLHDLDQTKIEHNYQKVRNVITKLEGANR